MTTIKEITCYQTEDGKIWTTVEQAEFWDKCIVSAAAGREAYKKDTTYNFRNEGESTRVDRYAGRGL